MTLIAPRPESTGAPATRALRLAALALPGSVLALCSAAAVSMASGRLELLQAVQTAFALR